MREIHVREIEETVRRLFLEANFTLGPGVLEALKAALREEVSPLGREVLGEMIENARIASEERIPLCQDTGLAVVFLEIGQEVRLVGGDLHQAINRGVRRAYAEGYLRKSVCHPFSRKNTGDNTPAVIHLDLVPGDKVRVVALAKGGGSENTSRVTVLPPSAGKEGIMGYVIDCVREAGPNPCPPILVGIGVGSSLEGAAIMAKKALLRPVGGRHPDPEVSSMEGELLERINSLGIGPQGYGGRVTALGVHMEVAPCHIASLPVAVNIQCHCHRWKEESL